MYTKSFDKTIKQFGFIKDQKGIFNRFLRENDNWEPHLTNTKEVIRDFITKNDAKSIAVLGSGWLLDFPIDIISGKNIIIDLFDLYHPKQISQFIKKWKNVNAIKIDLSGGIIGYIINCKKKKQDITIKMIEEFLSNQKLNFQEYSMVISLNLISQIPLLIEEYLLNKYNFDIEREEFFAILQQFHLNSLPKGKSLIITDIKENYTIKGEIVKSKDLLYTSELMQLKVIKKWKWRFDTKKMYDPLYEIDMDVAAFNL